MSKSLTTSYDVKLLFNMKKGWIFPYFGKKVTVKTKLLLRFGT